MAVRTSVILFALLFACANAHTDFVKYEHQLDAAEFPKQNISELESLKKFVELVEEHKMNVSIIVSQGKNWEEGNLKEAMAMTLTFPVNQESTTEKTLTKEAFEKLAKAANSDKLTFAGTNARSNQLSVMSNNIAGVPINKAYKIFTGIKNGKTGFVFDEENYVAAYSFQTIGSDGKNETTIVLHGDVDVEVVDKAANVKDTDVAKIKKVLIDSWFTYDDEIIPKAVAIALSKELPDQDWDVAGQVGGHSYVDSNYWVHLKIVNEDFLIYHV